MAKIYIMQFPKMQLTVEEAATILRISTASTRQYIRKGILRATKVGTLRTSPYLIDFDKVMQFKKVLRAKQNGLSNIQRAIKSR